MLRALEDRLRRQLRRSVRGHGVRVLVRPVPRKRGLRGGRRRWTGRRQGRIVVQPRSLPGHAVQRAGSPCGVAVRRSHDHKRHDPGGALSGVRVRGSGLLAFGREHVPDPLGLFIKTGGLATLPSGLSATIPDLGSLTWANFAWSLVPVTLGTLIGGAGLVGAVYWFVYLRSQGRA